MKAIIDKDGYLEILRGGTYRQQKCPFTTIPDIRPDGDGAAYTERSVRTDCGDWCPLFQEPYIDTRNIIHLQICHANLSFAEIEDEREKA